MENKMSNLNKWMKIYNVKAGHFINTNASITCDFGRKF